ncbi:MAG: hypothetical protein LBL59_09640 [Xanthomonadaceae bacterium]|jgi:hypothetical protein|nr:hypothetical protein [Xanthomonadaceae bacterium]
MSTGTERQRIQESLLQNDEFTNMPDGLREVILNSPTASRQFEAFFSKGSIIRPDLGEELAHYRGMEPPQIVVNDFSYREARLPHRDDMRSRLFSIMVHEIGHDAIDHEAHPFRGSTEEEYVAYRAEHEAMAIQNTFAGYRVYSRFSDKGNSMVAVTDKSLPVAAGAGATASAGNGLLLGSSSAPRWSNTIEYITDHSPRIPAMPWSAPVYDGRATTVDPAVYCMSAGEGVDALGTYQSASCRCVTEQGTPYRIDDTMCFYLARHGAPYNPYKQMLQDGGAFGVWSCYCRKFGGDGEQWVGGKFPRWKGGRCFIFILQLMTLRLMK